MASPLEHEPESQSGIQKIISTGAFPSPNSYWHPNFTTSIIPINCWSHNDEHQPISLYTALAAGCIAIEADCFTPSYYSSSHFPASLFSYFSSPETPIPENDLLVGHETSELHPTRTLSSLYLNPLLEILIQQNKAAGNPKKKVGVWNENPYLPLHLTIDYKTVSSGHDGIHILYSLLEPLRTAGFLTYYDNLNEKLVPGPLTIVGTGDADFELICAYERVYIFKDARFFNFLPSQNPYNSLYVSANISTSIGRFSKSKGPTKEQVKSIRKECREVRERGLIPRYWGTPDDEEWWRVLVESGIEVLNCDDLERGGRWLRGYVVNGVGVGALWKEDVKEGEEEGWEGGCIVL
ncbi:2f87a52a-8562-4fee-a251-edb819767634-CDS [Sclerotinia trifoliorum]|uniref:2f87a52a-8562-4fee-a251-edb819767634-CDS n=1 Tax=Sclerotinia trifoliorum TaxID=28548 RepID=A0A8H2VRD6_9HELO|nr:2f87a52a-8562-4fee-a251-edb819767634-CDS [Sclerotinia trifoliorum]